jgi:hypothetical protein
MKRFSFLLIVFIGFHFFSFAQGNNNGPVITFDKDVHNYGTLTTEKIPSGEITFKVYNRGEQPLILTNVRACCGTQVKDYTKGPIAPRDSGSVVVEFRILQRPHRISRTVTIQSNATNRQTAVLRIMGEIVEPEDNSLKLE